MKKTKVPVIFWWICWVGR